MISLKATSEDLVATGSGNAQGLGGNKTGSPAVDHVDNLSEPSSSLG